MDAQIKKLEKQERKMWNAMMNGSIEDARTVYGKEGKNYLAWCAAADECREYRDSIVELEVEQEAQAKWAWI